MKAITIHQPWAQLIADGRKRYETRSWAPPRPLIGQPLAIHASKSAVGRADAERFGLDWDTLPRGAVLCTAKLVAAHHVGMLHHKDVMAQSGNNSLCRTQDPDYAPETRSFPTDEYSDYYQMRWAWRLVDVVALDPPIPARGAQGLWVWDADR